MQQNRRFSSELILELTISVIHQMEEFFQGLKVKLTSYKSDSYVAWPELRNGL